MIFTTIIAQEKQDSLAVKENPIIFGDILLGYANTGKSAVTVGLNINYQSKNDLFTFRTSEITSIDKIEWFPLFPFLKLAIQQLNMQHFTEKDMLKTEQRIIFLAEFLTI